MMVLKVELVALEKKTSGKKSEVLLLVILENKRNTRGACEELRC